MSEKIIGADDTTPTGLHPANYFFLTCFQAFTSGNMTEFKLRSDASGHVKCALYADNSGEPGSLITAMNTGQAVVSGWNTLNFTSTPVTNGMYYWLAINMDTNYAGMYVNGIGTGRYRPQSYAGFSFPDPAGGGFTVYSYYTIEAGWGETESITPKTSSDSGAGSDTKESFPATFSSRAETGSGLETAGINAGLASSDAGNGAEFGQPSWQETVFGSDGGSGADSLKILTSKAGSDLRLHSHQGQVSIPHKEVRS